MKQIVSFILLLLKGTPFAPIATDIQNGIDAGKITIGEAEQFIEDATKCAEPYWPKGTPMLEAFEKLVVDGVAAYQAFEDYQSTAGKTASATTPAEKA